MTTVATSTCKLLVLPSAARSTLTSYGNDTTDILGKSRPIHTGLYNIAWWNQPGMKCYTPAPHFKAYHSVLADGNASEAVTNRDGTLSYLPDPTLSTQHPIVAWKRTSGNNYARAVVPLDTTYHTAEIKIAKGNAAVGSAWSFQTTSLGLGWDSGFGATKPGMLPENGGVAFVIHTGIPDTVQVTPDPDPAPYTGATDGTSVVNAAAAQQASQSQQLVAQGGEVGNIRCRVGNIWSVLLPGDGSAPLFQKKVGAKNGGPNWVTMHTFNDVGAVSRVDGSTEIIVSIVPVAGRITVTVGSKDLPNHAYSYSELDPRTNLQKFLTIPSAPAVISGINDGGPVWFSLRRIGWNNFAQFSSTLTLTDTNTPGIGGNPALAPSGAFYAVGYTPALAPGVFTQLAKLNANTLQYTVTLTASSDDREPCAVKWVKFYTGRATGPGTPSYVDYGPALTKTVETCAQPDFSGVGGNRGSDGVINLTFDMYGLDKIAAANGTDWRTDLAAYSEVVFVMGNLFNDKTSVEVTRMKGYLMNPKYNTQGFHDSTFTVELRDSYVRLRKPAGFIDQRYAPISMINSSNPAGVYGYEGIKYILGKAIDQQAADSLTVYMPPSWPPLAEAYLQSTGKVPPTDTPNFMPPYGEDAAKYINDVALVDYAALFPLGDTWIYGQFDLIVAGLPTVTVNDGTDGSGNILGSVTDTQINFSITEAEQRLDTSRDVNKFVVWGKPPEGAGVDNALGEKFGVYIIAQSVQDSADIANSWERVDLTSSGQFYDPTFVSRYLQTIQRLTFGKRIGLRCKATMKYAPIFPAGSPVTTMYWGYKMLIQGASDVRLNGLTMRITRMTITADWVRKSVKTDYELVEVIGP